MLLRFSDKYEYIIVGLVVIGVEIGVLYHLRIAESFGDAAV